MYSLMDNVDTTPEPLEDVLPTASTPADEENPLGSRNEDERATKEEEIDKLALDIKDDVANNEAFLPLEVPPICSLMSSAPAALTRVLIQQEVLPCLARYGLVQGGHHTKRLSTHERPL